ncbi:hypothetical protein EBT25_03595 [bacterium]|nr:hypothetical protein [bacterium]
MVRGENGTPGTGGGGGGGASIASPGPGNYVGNPITTPGSQGGSGIVIIRYLTSSFCPRSLPNFNIGLKACTVCPDATPVYTASGCTQCPAAKPFWNGIACVTSCPSVLPRADVNKVCQLPCSGAAPNWDGNQCTKVCPESAPVATNGVCGTCQTPTIYWNPITKSCVSSCPETRFGNVCKTCYEIDTTRPYWNGAQCLPCPPATPVWTGPLLGCQACPPATPVYHNGQCKTCYQYDTARPFYNQTPDVSSYPMMDVRRCQPCPVSTFPKWNTATSNCQACEYPSPYWNNYTNACEACPVATPYWNTRVCALPRNIITNPMTGPVTDNVAASATTSYSSASLPWKAFDGDASTTSWVSDSLYSSGLYTGKRVVRDRLSGTDYRGEFLQVEFPKKYIISSYILGTTTIRRWAVFGSLDGLSWDMIDNRTASDTTNFSQTFYITPPISNAYTVFRLVATKVAIIAASVTNWSLQTASDAVTDVVSEDKSALTVITGAIEGCTSLSCVIDKAAKTDITDLVYGNYPPSEIELANLPEKAQQTLSNCTSNVDCGFVQFDFISNASVSRTSAPYTVSTYGTTYSDTGVFQKKYGTNNAPKLRAPPGFKYLSSGSFFNGTPISTSTVTVVECGRVCANNPNCQGFNFGVVTSVCSLYSMSATLSDSWDSAISAFIRDPYIKTSEQNKNRLAYTNLDDSGSYCQNMPACNTDVNTLIDQLGTSIQSFSTAELDSCNYCPVRGVSKQESSYVVTDEANISVTYTTTAQVKGEMTYSNVSTITHVPIQSRTQWRIRPYADPTQTAIVTIPGNGQIWVGNEPFAAGIAPKNCSSVIYPKGGGNYGSISDYFPLYAMGTIVSNSRTGEVCLTTERGDYTYQTCSGSCATGSDLDPGTHDETTGKNTRGGGIGDLLVWDFIPVDWVTNGYYIRSRGSSRRIWGMGPTGIKYDAIELDGQSWGNWKPANLLVQPYLKWGAYIGRYSDVGQTSAEQMASSAAAFASGIVAGATLGFVNIPTDRNDPNNVFFNSFPPQFQTMGYPTADLYADLQTLPSQQPGGSKFDDKDYIFVLEPV